MHVELTLPVAQSHAQWSPASRTCAVTDTVEFKWSLVINFIEDFGLLGIMVAGVLHKRGPTELWDMLYCQSLFWVLAAILAKLPTLVCRSCPQRCLIRRVNSFCFIA